MLGESCFFANFNSLKFLTMKVLFELLSKWKNLLLLTSLFLLFNFLLSNIMPKDFALDLMFAYTPEEAYNALSQLDSEQRKLYRFGIWALDMPYMIIYSFLFSGVLLRIYKNKKMVWIPATIMLMDFFENLTVLRMLKLFPIQDNSLALIASAFTTMKWVIVGMMIILIVYGTISVLNARFFSNSGSEEARI